MRFRTGNLVNRWSRPLRAAVGLALLLVLVVAGCGGGDGGGGGGGATPTPVPTATPTPSPAPLANFRVRIDWGARSRVEGLSSALSAEVILEKASANGTDIRFTVNRPSGTSAIAQEYSAPVQARVGEYILRVLFYGLPDKGGDQVGFAGASATVVLTGDVSTTIASYTGVSSVRILPGQSVGVGETRDIVFEARNVNNTIVSVTPGSAKFTIFQGSANVSLDALRSPAVTGLRPTEATLYVEVDRAKSPNEKVLVTSNTTVTVDPSSITMGPEFTQTFNATVSNPTHPTETDVTFALPAGDNGSFVKTANSIVYTAPKVTGTARVINLTVTSVFDPVKQVVVPITVEPRAVVRVTPNPVQLSMRQRVSFSATVENLAPSVPAADREVTWEVLPDPSGESVGTIDAAGVYTAPKRLTNITVRARSKYDPSRFTDVLVSVVSLVGVNIDPVGPIDVVVNRSQSFTATVLEVPATEDQSVTWSFAPEDVGQGTITPGANNTVVYRAPAQKGDGVVVLNATSNFDSTKKASVRINVVSGSVDIIVK